MAENGGSPPEFSKFPYEYEIVVLPYSVLRLNKTCCNGKGSVAAKLSRVLA